MTLPGDWWQKKICCLINYFLKEYFITALHLKFLELSAWQARVIMMQIQKVLLKQKCYFSYTGLKERRACTHRINYIVQVAFLLLGCADVRQLREPYALTGQNLGVNKAVPGLLASVCREAASKNSAFSAKRRTELSQANFPVTAQVNSISQGKLEFMLGGMG